MIVWWQTHPVLRYSSAMSDGINWSVNDARAIFKRRYRLANLTPLNLSPIYNPFNIPYIKIAKSFLSHISSKFTTVNLRLTFNGNSFLPKSVPGFIQPINLKLGWTTIGSESPLSKNKNSLPSIAGMIFYNNSLLAKFISSINTQWPFYIALIKAPVRK